MMCNKENMSKDMGSYHSQEIYPTNMGKNYWIVLQEQDLRSGGLRSGDQYSVSKNTRFKFPMLRSDLCDYSVVYRS